MLGGVSGWGYDGSGKTGGHTMTVRVVYADGQKEDHQLYDGIHFADYIRRIDMPKSEPQVALHLLASVPNGLCVEIFPSYQRDPMWFDLPEQQPTIQNGQMHVPDSPGFGMPLNQEVIEKWRAKEDSPESVSIR